MLFEFLTILHLTSWAHVDPAYCKFAFTYCVGREFAPTPSEEVVPPRNLRSTQQHSGPASRQSQKSAYKPGANFVDATLRVVVEQDPATLIAFQPGNVHGTSKGNNLVGNAMITITFSQKVGDEWAKARRDGHPMVSALPARKNGAGIDEVD